MNIPLNKWVQISSEDRVRFVSNGMVLKSGYSHPTMVYIPCSDLSFKAWCEDNIEDSYKDKLK
jgi:hypothetical protein